MALKKEALVGSTIAGKYRVTKEKDQQSTDAHN